MPDPRVGNHGVPVRGGWRPHRVRGGLVVQTLIGCEDEYGERIRAVLTGTVTHEIEASGLTLVADDGRGVMLTAEG
ncbi:MAG: hypothetical protein ACSLFO_12095 [Acidimicrobiales bacterium]